MGFVEVLIISFGGIFLLIALYILSIINRLSFHINKIDEKYYTIYENMLKTIKIEDDLYKTIKSENVSKANGLRQELIENKDIMNQLQTTTELINLITKDLKLIKNSKEKEEIKDKLKEILDNIDYASLFYNKCITDYDEYRNNKFVRIISKIFKYRDYPYINKEKNEDRAQ